MKKKIIIPIVVVILISIYLFVPFQHGKYEDGGTEVYGAKTYKVVKWKRLQSEYDENGELQVSRYENTTVFWYPDCKKSIDELWEMEVGENSF